MRDKSMRVLCVWLLGITAVLAWACSPAANSDGDADADADSDAADGAADGDADADADNESDADGPPPSEEICDDGIDNDLDGMIDEGCACLPGETRDCFTGTAAQRNQGICRDGVMTCTGGSDSEFGVWGECVGDVTAEEEVCDPEGLDENCSGEANEGCECSEGDPPMPCGSDVGACVPGTQECIDGVWAPCEGAIGPTAEICNGVDDDCDSETDEEVPALPCGTDVGACRPGEFVCVDGSYTTDCIGAILATDETCNGIDDDCDGDVDEEVPPLDCGVDTGACDPGTMECTDGVWGDCEGGVGPTTETCNDIDDNCNGTVDEGLTRPCGTDTGDCMGGTETCSAGDWGACIGAIGPTAEDCDGGDEDCDGLVDEDCTCTDGDTAPCGSDVGECVAGEQTCTGGSWGACVGDVGPTAEICDGLDNDCDGAVDDGLSCTNTPPEVTCPPDVTDAVLATVTLSATASDPDGDPLTYSWTVTGRPAGSTSTPASPTSMTTTFFLDAAGTFTLEFCATDDSGDSDCCTVTVTATAPGDLHIELSWDSAWGDADLHLLGPGAASDRWFTVDDCYFNNPTPDWGPVGADANPTLDRDDTDGFGPENITITLTPTDGTYTVGVAYYCERSVGTSIDPGSGPVDATVRVYCGGALVDTISGIDLDETGRWVTVAEVEWPGCSVRTVGTREWVTEVIDPALWGLGNVFHCNIPCTTPGSATGCLPGENCYDTDPSPRRTDAYCFYDL